jgi:hypothetical protein
MNKEKKTMLKGVPCHEHINERMTNKAPKEE